ncbi:conjugative transfer protein MobI(A/C) [Motilimonas eburnea]|uniref:conjugative transfer protein MobI(A/C) n=1 Tax=Motilimonas eburnea TaxID=1737488 RepID=UPI001E466C46|nr:conjugative transfer protein MobI(A/C) [Motilimonas eburnea]MCE2571775.1 hypothetical protein [Motilimonas eburnea]
MIKTSAEGSLLSSINAVESEVRSQAKVQVDMYWEAWKAHNSIHLAKGDLKQLGRFAPLMRKTSTGHEDIDWRDFGEAFFRKKNKHYSKRVKPYKDGYRLSQFRRQAQDWEIELINEYLEPLNRFRAELKVYHECRVLFNRYQRKYIQKTSPQTEENNNEQ